MKLALLLAAALLGNCFAVDPNAKFYYYRSNEPLTRKTMYPKQNANEYMDQILENLREFMILNGMDTLPLPDQIEAFSEEFLGITWHGEASLTQGYIRGLETIHRSGDAELDLLLDGGINMKTELGFNDMDGGYLMHVDFMGIGIDAYAAVWVYSLRMYMDATIKIGDETTPTEAVINEFDIRNPGLIVVNIDGLGSLDFILELLADLVMNIFGGLIVNAIADDLKDALQEILGNIVDPPTLMM
ncbi:unnamed protein product [Cyprideis torosa]|uniref:Uncharacterized protein n=1 Tax=Cyprideis torosa TaxID=163714 RepID=A0A7R8ZMX6_9CRUS|nr:unnamed protein product [Cyprideis torosa]CAG0896648.1 unnamed protein product [Cyprideis torosa]